MELTQATAHRSTYPSSRSLIQTFPSELLLSIFKYVYVAARTSGRSEATDSDSDSSCSEDACAAEQKCFCCVEPLEEYVEYRDNPDEVPPLALFPNSVASVRPRWGELMLLVPVFWTRIVVFLDGDTFSPKNLQRQLNSLGKRPFDIIIARTSFSDVAGLKDVEQSRMAQIITALRSHFHRCRSLRIEVIYSASLPRLLAILPSDMPHLRKLSLDSRIDTGRPGAEPYCLVDRETTLNWCNMDSIIIDGWNLFDLCDPYPTPEGIILSRDCHSLSVKFGEITETSIAALIDGCLLQNLNIDSVTIIPDINFSVTVIRAGIRVSSHNPLAVTLQNLGADATEVILRCIDDPLQLTIDNCRFPSSSSPLKYRSQTLELRNIDLGQGLEDFIPGWYGATLLVIGCPGFNDNILNIMGSMVSNQNWRQPYRTKGFYIQNCHGFSVDALKEFVEKGIDDRRGRTGHLETLCVVQARSLLPEEDIKWFKTRVSRFSWPC